MSHKLNAGIAVIGIDIGKNSFHVVGHDKRGAIMLRQKWSRGQTQPPYGTLMPQSGAVHSIIRLGWILRAMAACPLRPAGSTGRCNTGVKFLCRGFKSQGLAWPLIELAGHFVEMGLRVHRQVGSFRKKIL